MGLLEPLRGQSVRVQEQTFVCDFTSALVNFAEKASSLQQVNQPQRKEECLRKLKVYALRDIAKAPVARVGTTVLEP